jgi:hypothetical protein
MEIPIFISRKVVKKPRFWTDEEWSRLNDKEKAWIWYKHHWTLIAQGNAEVDNILFFTQGQFLTLFGMWIVVMKEFNLPGYTLPLPFVWFIANKYIMWKIGNWKDKKDLIALENELSNKRNKFCRELREQEMKALYRKGLKKSGSV